MNSSAKFDTDYDKHKVYRLAVTIFISVLFFIGVFSNFLILVVVKRTPSMHSVTNILLCNLAVLDLSVLLWPLVGVVLESLATKRNLSKHTENVICKLGWSVLSLTYLCSILTLTLIAIERYHALVKAITPGFSIRVKRENVKYFLFVLWLLGLNNAIGVAVLSEFKINHNGYSSKKTENHCINLTDGSLERIKIWTLAYSAVFTSTPIPVVFYCYFKIIYSVFIKKTVLGATSAGREEIWMRKRLVCTSIVAGLAFILFYSPLEIIGILFSLDVLPAIFYSEIAVSVMYFIICLKAILNPFLYAFHSTNYRIAVKTLFHSCCFKMRNAFLKFKVHDISQT